MAHSSTEAAPVAAGSTRRERVGWYFYDWANSAFYSTVITVFLGPYLTSIAETAAGCGDAGDSCAGAALNVFGWQVAPGSLYPYTVSLSVFLTIFVLPVVGAIADRSAHKKQLLAGCAYVGAGATVGMLFLTGDRYLLGAGLLVLANVAFGASIVIYYSFLPQLAGPDERDAVSSVGWAFGYIGGGIVLALNLGALLLREQLGLSTADAARYSIVSAGLWWAGFTTVPLLLLRNRLPAEGPARRHRVLSDGFRQLWETLRGLRRYPLTLLFLVAFLIYNDGIFTVITMSGVYAGKELKLPDTVLVPTILVVQFLAFFGALALGALAKRIGARRTILIALVLWIAVLVVTYLMPPGRAVLFVLLGGVIGIVLGGSQALSRSLFSQLIPTGREGEYFGLYEISDRGTSWLGPLLFGFVYGVTGSYRQAVISLIGFFIVGGALLVLVPIRRAILAAGNVPPRVL